ncbi:MAG: alpha/beta fold hydrolase [Candidatus Hodarchaeota archaeon]
MSFAYVNGINISYEISGNGFPVIFIHGFGSKKEIWKPQVIELSKKFKTITFDLRGTGLSDRPDYPYTMAIFADDIKGLMDYLQIESAHIIGRSLGGMIGQNFVLKYPQYVKKLVLIATNAKFDDEATADLIIENRIKNTELSKEDPVKAFWNNSKFLYHQKFRQELKRNPKKKFYGVFSLEDLIEESKTNPSRPQDIRNQGSAMKGHNTIDILHQIKSQTLLLAASNDRLIPKSTVDDIHKRIPNSIMKVISNAGHFMTLSKAPEINDIILEFLKSEFEVDS